MKFFNTVKLFLYFLIFVPSFIYSTLMYNQYDPFSFHTIYGINNNYKKQNNKIKTSINISPFYQYASGAKDGDGNKVPEGDMLGWWNLFGLFYGVSNNEIKAAPPTKKFVLEGVNGVNIPDNNTQANYPKISAAWRVLDNENEGSNVADYDKTDLIYDFTDPEAYRVNKYTFKEKMPSTYVEYEKFGLRTQINFNFDCGIGINIKGGLVDYKQYPTFKDRDSFNSQNQDPDVLIYKYLRETQIMADVLGEVDLNILPYQVTTLEDTYIQVYWQVPFDVMNNDDEVAVKWMPYLAAGLWIPTGKEKNQDIQFSIPTGNDGFWGVTFDSQINFVIPEAIQFGFGGGIALFFERDLDNYRVASHEYQMGIFPWKANICKDPGLLWNISASMQTVEFIDNFSAYVGFVYLRHNKDKITMIEKDSIRNNYFLPSVNEENSKWRAAMFQGGIEYNFGPGLHIGIGLQTYLSGRRVYRNTTILGTMSLMF